MITLQNGRYEALELIGSGATSRVEKARDNVIGRTVALKTFVSGFDEGLEQQFLQEARLVGQLSHPAVVQLYDVGIGEDGTPFLVMEYIAGRTIENYFGSSTLTIQRACAWTVDLAGALAAAHRAGMIHGDIKPGNILVTPEHKVKLGDFGIARLATQSARSGRVTGTPAYLAPEQIQSETQDHRSDQFSLGIVFYQMLTGIPPFDGSSLGAVCCKILNAEPAPPSQLNPAVPPALDAIVARCLEKNPQDRFASCEEFARALYPFARRRPQPAAPVNGSAAQSAPAAELHIEITSAMTEGTLAIFADQELISTTNLRSHAPGARIPFERQLSPGPHQLRVAYYKPDRSLLSEKEGLGEISSSGENKLVVHVERRARRFFSKELALNVTWPGAPAPSSEDAAAVPISRALMHQFR